MAEEIEEVTETQTETPEPEKTLTQSQVNAIVQREKQQALQRGQQMAEEKLQQQMAQQQQSQAKPETSAQSPNLDENADAIYQQIQERFNQDMQQKQLQQEISQVADNYLSKMQAGKDGYEDFEKVTADFEPASFPQLVYLVSGMDNAADVVYELAKNPSKLVTLDTLAQKSPNHAKAELNRLAKSITENKAALNDAKEQHTDAPLDRMQPSRVNSSGGQMSIQDLRNQPWLRG